jgi:CIC family chloride channel protein
MNRPREVMARVAQHLRSVLGDPSTQMLALGATAGVLGGVTAGVFDLARLVWGHLALGTADPSIEVATWWRLLLAPIAAGVLASGLLHLLGVTRPVGMAGVIEAVQLRGGRVGLRDGLGTAAAAVISLGAGHSGGREAPVAGLSAAVFHAVGGRLRLRSDQLRVLVACSAAAAISASFNTPLGSSALALELILGSFALRHFGPVVTASVVGTLVGSALLGDRVAFHAPAFELGHPAELLGYAGLGVWWGLIAVAYQAAVTWMERTVEGLAWSPAWRGAAAGAIVGLLGAAGLPGVMGTGYGLIDKVLADPTAIGGPMLFVLLVGKIMATAVTFGGRGGAGLFSPILVVGALAGVLFGLLLQAVIPTASAGSFALVAMGAVSAAVLRAPLAMVLVLFELTGSYAVVPTMLITVSVALLVVSGLRPGSMEEELLGARGVPLRPEIPADLRARRVGDLMRTSGYVTVPLDPALDAVVRAFQDTRADLVWVVDEAGRYAGCIDVQDVLDALGGGTAREGIVRHLDPLRPDQPVADALAPLSGPDTDELPVVDADGRLIGVLFEHALLEALGTRGWTGEREEHP